MSTELNPLPHLIVILDNQRYALSSERVQEILLLPECVPIPNASANLRGALNLRGKVIPILDLRLRLGLTSLHSSNTDDTRNWLQNSESTCEMFINKLSKAVRGEGHFDVQNMKSVLDANGIHERFDKLSVKLNDELDSMSQLLSRLRDTLEAGYEAMSHDKPQEALEYASLARKNVFGELKTVYAKIRKTWNTEYRREQAVILARDGMYLGLSVDMVESAEILNLAQAEPLGRHDMERQGLIKRSVRDKDDRVVLLLEIEELLNEGDDA